jgi:hypothetical protein
LCSTVRLENDAAKVAAIVSNVTVRLCAVAVDVCAIVEMSEHGEISNYGLQGKEKHGGAPQRQQCNGSASHNGKG